MPQLIPSALRVLQVFELFARERKPLSNSDIAKGLQIPESSCSDLLHTLRHAGYVVRMPGSRKFQLTSRLSAVAGDCVLADGLTEFIDEVLLQLTRLTGETAMCAQLENGRVKVIACQESPKALRYVLKPGTILDTYATAVGKALLSIQGKQESARMLKEIEMRKIASGTITDQEELLRQLEQGRATGFFVARNEGTEGVYAIAFACTISSVQLAFNVVGPVHRVERNQHEYSTALLKIKADLSG